MSNPYQDIIPLLKYNHFYPNFKKMVKKKGEEVVGLLVDCPPILMDDRVERLKEVLGDGWVVSGNTNDMEITITKK